MNQPDTRRLASRSLINLMVRALPASMVVILVAGLGWHVWNSLKQRGVTLSFNFLNQVSGFPLSENLIGYEPGGSYGYAILAGIGNTVAVSVFGIILATVLGFLMGVAGRAAHPLVRAGVRSYIEVMRNVPLLVLLLGLALALRIGTPPPLDAWQLPGGAVLSNRGLVVPSVDADLVGYISMAGFLSVAVLIILFFANAWLRASAPPLGAIVIAGAIAGAALMMTSYTVRLDKPTLNGFNYSGGITASPEFTALLVGLSLYTSAFIAEIVRGALRAVKPGQREAANALGLTKAQTLLLITLPQAVRLMLPPLTNQYLNLTKNSSLAVIVGYPDLVTVGNTVLNQTGRAIEMVSIYLIIYLSLSLTIAFMTRVMERRADRIRGGR